MRSGGGRAWPGFWPTAYVTNTTIDQS